MRSVMPSPTGFIAALRCRAKIQNNEWLLRTKRAAKSFLAAVTSGIIMRRERRSGMCYISRPTRKSCFAANHERVITLRARFGSRLSLVAHYLRWAILDTRVE